MTAQQPDEVQEPPEYTYQRPVGLLEKYQLSKQLTRGYGTVTATVQLHHDANPWATSIEADIKRFYLQKLYPALNRLIKEHPQLSLAVLYADEPTASLVHLSSVDLENLLSLSIVSFWETSILTDVIADECRREFDLESLHPLWRLRICAHPEHPEQCTITLTVHHVIADGMSLSIFWQELLMHLNSNLDPMTGDDYVIHYSLKQHSLAGPMEARGAPIFSAMGFAGAIAKALTKKVLPLGIAKQFYPSMDSWQGNTAADPKATHNTRVRLLELGGESWQEIVQYSKQYKVSVHAALYTAMMLAWLDAFGGSKTVTGITPLNARKLCTPAVPANEMGNFVGAVEKTWTSSFLDTSKDDPWSFTKEYYQHLQKNKTSAVKEAGLLSFLRRYPADYIDFWEVNRKNYRLGRSGGLELSDLGRFESKTGAWKVDKMWFCQSAQIFSTALGVSTITTNGTMFASLQWQKGSLTEESVDVFAARFLGLLESMTKQKS